MSYSAKSIPAHKENQPCKFCGEDCKYINISTEWSDYWWCGDCKWAFERYSMGANHPVEETSTIFCSIKGKDYCLRQFINKKQSRIEIIPKNMDDTVIIVAEFNFLFPDVTPQNIADKIPIYILFS